MDTTTFLPAIPGKPKVLALNGGGTSGRATATFLADFEASTRLHCSTAFDLVAGVSTGSILAAGLGLGMPAEELAEKYAVLAPKVFGRPWYDFYGRFVRGWLDGARYGQSDLRAAVTELLGAETTLGDCTTRIAIRACCLTNPAGPVTWCSWRRRHKHLKLVDVVLASCAAPTYFKPFCLDGSVYVDGAMATNNPSMVAVRLVESLTHDVDHTYVLNVRPTSIQGLSYAKASRLRSAKDWVLQLPSTFMAMSDEDAAQDVQSLVDVADIVDMKLDLPLDYVKPDWLDAMDSAAHEAWKTHAAAITQHLGVL